MTARELEDVYTLLCRCVGDAGAETCTAIPARLKLLTGRRIGNGAEVSTAIEQAADGLVGHPE